MSSGLGCGFDLSGVEAVEAVEAVLNSFPAFTCEAGRVSAILVAAVGAGGGDEVWFEFVHGLRD